MGGPGPHWSLAPQRHTQLMDGWMCAQTDKEIDGWIDSSLQTDR